MSEPLEQTVCRAIVDATIRQLMEDGIPYQKIGDEVEQMFDENLGHWPIFWNELEERVIRVYNELYKETGEENE